MYTRAYPPRNAPLPQNYSGVALMGRETAEEEKDEGNEVSAVTTPPSPTATETAAPIEVTDTENSARTEESATPPKAPQEQSEESPPHKRATDSQTADAPTDGTATAEAPPPAIDTADMLLLTLAALLSQNGHTDGELIMVLLLLLLGV